MATPLFHRREFTVDAVWAALAGVTIAIGGCGGGGYSGPSAPSPPSPSPAAGSDDEMGSISNNHGHSAIVTGVQLGAGSALQLDIRGTSDHPHTVVLTADALQAIKTGRAVQADSTTTSGHLHTVTFNAESTEPPVRY